MRKVVLNSLALVGLLMVGCQEKLAPSAAKKFDADEWADLFKKPGPKFAGPVVDRGARGYVNDLTFKTPDRKPCSHAYVFNIERHHRPPIG